jgi:hypothetical protein
LLLVILLVNGLVPSLGEIVETVAHRVATGHFAHSEAETDLGDQGSEHGCGTTAHLCRCCPSQPVTPGLIAPALPERACDRARAAWRPDTVAAGDHRPAPFRPPIG